MTMALAYRDPSRPNVVTRPDGGLMSRRMAENAGYTIVPHPAPGANRATAPGKSIPSTTTTHPQAEENRLVAKGVTRAFGIALRQLPEAACRPAAAAKLASLEAFTADQVSAADFTIQPQLDRARTILRGLPVETAQAGDAPAGYCRTRRSVEVRMATLPQTAEGHRLRHKLGRVLLSVDEGRDINSALKSAGFDPAAYQA